MTSEIKDFFETDLSSCPCYNACKLPKNQFCKIPECNICTEYIQSKEKLTEIMVRDV